MTTMTIPSPFAGGERLPLFSASPFEALAWHRMLDVLVRSFTWSRKPQNAGVAATVAKTSPVRGIAR